MPKRTASLLAALVWPALSLAEDSTELDAVLVTSSAPAKKSEGSSPMATLKDTELRLKVADNIGETLQDELGISNQSFGPGVGAPVIRGQAGARVRVLANGVGSNDASAFSPDHPVSVEPILAERIEVLRGPATLRYGSGTIGGVVNVIDNRIPERLPDRAIGGAFEQRFDSTSDETASALKVEGGHGQWAYHLDGLYRQHSNLHIGGQAIDTANVALTDPNLQVVDNPNGHLDNTAAEAIGGSAGLSWIGADGFAGAAINNLNNNFGVPPDGSGMESVRIAMRQDKYDFKAELADPFAFAKKLRVRLGYTDYQHTELANGETGAKFSNESYEGRVELTHQDLGPLQGMFGFQAQASDFWGLHYHTHDDGDAASSAHPDPLVEALVPRTDSQSYAGFVLESFTAGDVTYQLGARVEQTDLNTESGQHFGFTPVSGALSALWQIDARHSLNAALTRSSRAPQVQELLADGYHHATRSWERGNSALHEENSYNLDFGYQFDNDWMRLKIDLFHNWAHDYIYQRRNGEFVNEDGDSACGDACVPVLVSSQGDAIFKGYEAQLVLPVFEKGDGLLELTLFSDYTRGEFVTGGDVPRMPPLRYGAEWQWSQEQWSAKLRLTRGEAQTHPGAYETATSGYLRLDIGADYRIAAGPAELLLFVKGNNLLDENIRNATSYLRNFAPEAGRGAEVGVRVDF